MGYSTDYTGELSFGEDITVKALKQLENLLDCRFEERWIDLVVTDDLSGLKWSEQEKTGDLTGAVNWIISEMRTSWPEFTLEGVLHAEGEEQGDVYSIYVLDGKAVRADRPEIGDYTECPHCHKSFKLTGE